MSPANTTVEIGATIALACSAHAGNQHPPPSISWLKDGKPLGQQLSQEDGVGSDRRRQGRQRSSDRSHQGRTNSDGTPQGHSPRYKVAPGGALQFFNIREEDGGVYTCVATNHGGTVSASATLTVKVRRTTPHPFDEKTKSLLPITYPAALGATFPSQGRNRTEGGGRGGGGGRGRGNGRRNGRNKKKGNKQRNGGGLLDPVRPETDDGEVKLVPPSRPDVAKLSDTSVMLTWHIPENNGLPITFFKVQYKRITNDRRHRGWRTIDDDLPAPTRMYEVPGLTPGATYRFRVVAVYSNNDNKQGPNSAKFKLDVTPELMPKAPMSGPVIVEARPVGTDAITIGWQYLSVDQSPIEGFFLYYKPYSSQGPYKKETILDPTQRRHTIRGLRPDTQYTINMQCFNNAGKSDFSNDVVKKTLFIGEQPIDVQPPIVDPRESIPSPQPTTPIEYASDSGLSTSSSSEMLYMVLGIVLGVMMLFLIVFMAMCAWKQRQQRRMMESMNANLRKFHDPAKMIYNDSLRKKHLINGSPFILNGIGPPITNGHGPPNGRDPPPGHQPHMNGGSNININVNPLSEMDTQVPENDDNNERNYQNLRSNLQEALPQPPVLPRAYQQNGHAVYDRSSQHRSDGSDTDNMCPPLEMTTFGRRHRLQEHYPEYTSSLKRPPGHGLYHLPEDNMSYRHATIDRVPYRSYNDNTEGLYAEIARDRAPEPSQVTNKQHRRRRRKHHNRSQDGSQDVSGRDMGTNTDLSSNDGTLEMHVTTPGDQAITTPTTSTPLLQNYPQLRIHDYSPDDA